MEHRQAAARNGTVHYWIDRTDKSADCIVFTHGLTADHTMFQKQVDFLAGKYNIIVWDVPMHGLSRPYRNFSYFDAAEILHRILKAEQMEKVLLVGMSMGGFVSQHFAALYPSMVKGFAALDTTPLGSGYYSKSDLWWLKQTAPIAKCFPDKLLRKALAWSVSKTKYSYDSMLSMLEPLSKSEIIEQIRIAYEYFPRENKDVRFSFPVLILVGDSDSTGKVKAYCREWAKQTGYPLHFIRNAKHYANGDNPRQVNQEIEAFMSSLVPEKC